MPIGLQTSLVDFVQNVLSELSLEVQKKVVEKFSIIETQVDFYSFRV
jgi:hypothetical protein